MSENFDLDMIWKTTLAQIEIKLDSPAHFKTWFQNTSLVNIQDKEATVGVPNAYSSDWLKSRHDKLITDTLTHVYSKPVKVKYVIDRKLANEPTPKVSAEEIMRESPLIGIGNMLGQDLNMLLRKANLNPSYTFGSMIVGSSNKLAHAAAKGVADNPGHAYNPLFIYGKTGLGKTHMAHAVARKILEKDPTNKALYATSEDFLNDMVSAIKTGKNKQFRDKYRSLDVLIIDDVQFTHKWKETQTEFFHTFNVLHSYNKQIILVSDRPPEEIKNLESRLRSRFQGGMIVDIAQPDYEMRLAILQQKSLQMGIDLPAHFNDFIAKAFADNIRELEGALHKVALYHSMRELTLEEIAKILGKDKQSKRSRVNIAKIIREVSKEFNITVKELKGPRRTADIAFARQVCMYLLREDFGFKLEDVAKQLERKDHTTVMHAVDKIKSKIMLDEGFKEQIDLIRDNISQHLEQ